MTDVRVVAWLISDSVWFALTVQIVAVAFVVGMLYTVTRKVTVTESRAFWFLSVAAVADITGYPAWGWWFVMLWLVFVVTVSVVPAIRDIFR